MELSLNEQQEMLKRSARDFMRQECPKETLLGLDKSDAGVTKAIWQSIASLGWLGLVIPEQYGGVGASLLDASVVFEELGRGPLPAPHFTSGALSALVVMETASEEQRKAILPGVASGDQVLALAMTEPDYGWGPENVSMRAERRGDGYVLNGVKLFVHHAQNATHLLVVARSGRQSANSQKGLTVFLVDRATPGVTVKPVRGFLGPVGQVKLSNVVIPGSAALGEPGAAWPGLQSAFRKAIPLLCSIKVGGCQAVHEMSVLYSQTRQAFGQPIGRFQFVQDHLITIVDALDSARWSTYEAIWKLDNNKEDAQASVHLAKAITSDAYHKACDASHEVHAGMGAALEYGLTMHTKASRGLYHYLGDPDFHKQRMTDALGW